VKRGFVTSVLLLSLPGVVPATDGKVQSFRSNFVDVKGRRTSRILHADFNKSVRKIQQIGFFQLDDQYDRYPLDKPK
jgi:hypothetical protein